MNNITNILIKTIYWIFKAIPLLVLALAGFGISACVSPLPNSTQETPAVTPLAQLEATQAKNVQKKCKSKKNKEHESELPVFLFDLLLVINSSQDLHMNGIRKRIASQLSALLDELPRETDTQLGILLAHGSGSYYSGRLWSRTSHFSILRTNQMTPNEFRTTLLYQLENTNTQVDKKGSGKAGLFSLSRALDPDRLAEIREKGFFRKSATLGILFVSNEGDICSQRADSDLQRKELQWTKKDCQNLHIKNIYNKILELQSAAPFLIGAAVYNDPDTAPRQNNNAYGFGFMDLIHFSHGFSMDLSNENFSEGLREFGLKINHLFENHPFYLNAIAHSRAHKPSQCRENESENEQDDFAGSFSCTVRSNQTALQCEKGEYLVGGGCHSAMDGCYPHLGKSWVSSGPQVGTGTAHAICCKEAGDIDLASQIPLMQPGAGTIKTITCPEGHIALGAGAYLSGGWSFAVTENNPQSVTFFAQAGPQNNFNPQVVCYKAPQNLDSIVRVSGTGIATCPEGTTLLAGRWSGFPGAGGAAYPSKNSFFGPGIVTAICGKNSMDIQPIPETPETNDDNTGTDTGNGTGTETGTGTGTETGTATETGMGMGMGTETETGPGSASTPEQAPAQQPEQAPHSTSEPIPTSEPTPVPTNTPCDTPGCAGDIAGV